VVPSLKVIVSSRFMTCEYKERSWSRHRISMPVVAVYLDWTALAVTLVDVGHF
jgi:hypothetical protein